MLATVIELLPVHGPWLLFSLAVLETCFVTGLVVPSGLATAAATAFALEGRLELAPMVVAAAAGGAVGDSVGFWIGRRWGDHVLRGEGRWSRLLGRKHRDVDELFVRHPIYSVTGARLVAFVRTVMPLAAGTSGLSYRRFLPYELAGLAGWVALYVTIGLLAGESWEAATRVVGAGGTLVFVCVGALVWWTWRRRTSARSRPRAGTGSG